MRFNACGLVMGKKLPADEGKRALNLLGRMTLTRYDHVPLLGRIWELRHNMWPYDAAYVALAESLRVDLVTVDSKLGVFRASNALFGTCVTSSGAPTGIEGRRSGDVSVPFKTPSGWPGSMSA
jgi:hypothetical protein